MILQLLSNLSYYLPELAIIIGMSFLLFMESTYHKNHKQKFFLTIFSVISLVICLSVLGLNLGINPVKLFAQSVVIDQFGTIAKMLCVVSLLGIVYLSYTSGDIYQELKSEFLIITFGVLAGAMLVISANNFLALYIGIEILSILSYVLASFNKNDTLSAEGGFKYAIYGAVSSGVMLFGISHIYGLFGSIQYDQIFSLLSGTLDADKLFIIKFSLILVFVGLGFKISAFPFHMWSPDVYQGSPTPVTAFFSLVPKIAGIAAIARITNLFELSNENLFQWWIGFIQIVAVLTMTFGNISALGQESVKRLLAFSSLGQIGFVLLALSLGHGAFGAVLFYMLIYLLMTLVSFYGIDQVVREYGSDSHYFFKGLINKHPFLAIFMSIALFSLAGMPPLAGFVAKFNVFNLIILNKHYGIALIVALNSVVALYYYLRLVKAIIVESSDDESKLKGATFLKQLFMATLTLPILLLGVFWDKAYQILNAASIFIKQ